METDMTKFIARRAGSDFNLFVDGVQFGRLADCEVAHIFITDDERLAQYVEIEADYSIREKLAAIRAGYEAYVADIRAEMDFERASESAWLRAAEYCPEAQADLYDRVSAY
jgi:hypothetical protein